jgi:hypothetical protein
VKRKSSSIYVDDGSGTDSNDLRTSGEEAVLEKKREKRRIARKKKKGEPLPPDVGEEKEEKDIEGGTDGMLIRDENGASIYDLRVRQMELFAASGTRGSHFCMCLC